MEWDDLVAAEEEPEITYPIEQEIARIIRIYESDTVQKLINKKVD